VKQCFGYIRVSTAKQGEHGVSLQEQRDAIARYAERSGLEIVRWFEERETAAKRGRVVFNTMLGELRRGKAEGVVIHKIDRSARNLKDWADLGELIDRGVQVLFTNESLDLTTRGGRLSADIQAVVAADYIRNLREETRKGFYGRLKQGVYPLPAPIGYVDRGQGKPKEIDPVKGPLVRKAFELYASGQYTLDTLGDTLWKLGLRNRRGGRITRTGISTFLNSPFYVGLMRIRRTGETFPGAHQPLIPKSLFDRVQAVLNGKTNTRVQKHRFLFRRLLTCKRCGYSLIGEIQKGHVYYRCHTPACPTTIVREELADGAFRRELAPLRFSDVERALVAKRISYLRKHRGEERDRQAKALALQRARIQERLNRLVDAYLDQVIDKETFESRKASLLLEEKAIEEQQGNLGLETERIDRVAEFLELAGSAPLGYEMGLEEEKRELIERATSNRLVEGKSVEFRLSIPFRIVAERAKYSYGPPYRDIPRTLDALLEKLVAYFAANPVVRVQAGDGLAA
jgi:DNA invertase Pin-like site-specific DNA recombinase